MCVVAGKDRLCQNELDDAMKRYCPGLLIVSALALSLVSPTCMTLMGWMDGGWHRIPYRSIVDLVPPLLPADLNRDGKIEQVVLNDGIAEIQQSGVTLWVTPLGWDVIQAQISDLNLDGQPEVALLVWRDFAPWPIDAYLPVPGRIKEFHNHNGKSSHLILIGWRRQEFAEIWAGSALANPLLAFAAADINNDNQQELVTIETSYDASLWQSQEIAIWKWNGFGFTLLSRGPEGYLLSLSPICISNGVDLILAQGTIRR